MHQHASTCLKGPVSRSRHSWKKRPSQAKDSTRRAGRNRPAGTESDIRHDLVARVRQEIAAGTYDTPEKWQAALDRFLERHLSR
jgi:hypothetical protein